MVWFSGRILILFFLNICHEQTVGARLYLGGKKTVLDLCNNKLLQISLLYHAILNIILNIQLIAQCFIIKIH